MLCLILGGRLIQTIDLYTPIYGKEYLSTYIPYSHQKFAHFIFRSLYISLPLIFAPLESNLLPLIFAPLIDLLFLPLLSTKRKFQGTYEIQNGYPTVINFYEINSAQFFKIFQIFQISVTNSLPLIFSPPPPPPPPPPEAKFDGSKVCILKSTERESTD